MNLDAISPLLRDAQATSMEFSQPTPPSFINWLENKAVETNEQLNKADEALLQLASGGTENLHQTMLVLEQAKLSFQLLQQIRNRLMGAYQELLREPI